MDLGFKQIGFHIEWANEIDEDAANTYEKNVGQHVYRGDIRKIQVDDIPSGIDLVIGGFPCQGFSMVGKRELDDERNLLYKEMKRIIEISKPLMFVAENVRGLLSMGKGEVIQQIVEEFTELGYDVKTKLLYAPEYGVPQERYRVFIVGSRKGFFHKDFEFPTKSTEVSRTVKESIGDLLELGVLANHEITQTWPSYYNVIIDKIGLGQKLCNSRHSDSSVYTWNIPEIYGETNRQEKFLLETLAKNRRRKEFGPKDGNPLPAPILATLTGFSLELTNSLIHSLKEKEYLVERANHTYDITKASFARFKRIEWDKPSPTILTNFDNPRNFLHPSLPRPLTVREAARLQTFPDDFIFTGKYTKQYRQVGNAVPPLLAFHVASAVWDHLSKDLKI